MRFRVGATVCVKNVYSGGNFENGDIVTIAQVGNEDEPNCYGAISPYDGMMWFLYEDEVETTTNADNIRIMSDEELSEFLDKVHDYPCESCCSNLYWCRRNNAPDPVCKRHYLEWLQQPYSKHKG